MQKYIWFIIGLISIILNSCDLSDEKSKNEVSFDYSEFERNVKSWKSLGIDNYTYEYYTAGFLYVGDVTVDVVEDKVVKCINKDGSDCIFDKTINDLIKQIRDVYKEYNNKVVSKDNDYYLTKIKIRYDENYFFPNFVDYDYHIPQNLAVDGAFSWKVKSFIK